MRVYLPLLISLAVILLFGLAEVLLLRYFNPGWWRYRTVKLSGWGLPLFGVVMVLLWALGEYYRLDWLAYPTAALTAFTFICEVGLMLSLPVSGVLHLVRRTGGPKRKSVSPRRQQVIDTRRRLLLKGAAAALPAATLSLGFSGFSRAFAAVNVYERPIRFDNLPPRLHGFRILHLSDLHLRRYVTLDDLADVLQQAEPFAVDLILVTGDIADDLRLLPEALHMIDALHPPHGTFACLGNHEYFQGVHAVRTIFDRSPVALLVNDQARLAVRGVRVLVGAIDDPRRFGMIAPEFYARALDRTLVERQSGEFTLVMSHRPDAFPAAAARAVHLTLSGHTHGAQVGFDGRSLFEPVLPEYYLWGHYEQHGYHLYTSSGVGHWFPFRLGCPPEAPVIVLKRGKT